MWRQWKDFLIIIFFGTACQNQTSKNKIEAYTRQRIWYCQTVKTEKFKLYVGLMCFGFWYCLQGIAALTTLMPFSVYSSRCCVWVHIMRFVIFISFGFLLRCVRGALHIQIRWWVGSKCHLIITGTWWEQCFRPAAGKKWISLHYNDRVRGTIARGRYFIREESYW